MHLAGLVQTLPSGTLDLILADVGTPLDADLLASLTHLDAGQYDNDLLLRTFACLRKLEARHRTESRRCWQTPPSVETVQGRHLLVPPLVHSTRPDDPDRTFPLSDDLAVAGVLGLGYRWLPMQAEDELSWSRFSDLDPLRTQGTMHVGLAPLGSSADMEWTMTSTEPLGLDRRVPMRCIRALDASALWDRIEAILATAYAAGVQVLLLPELVVDEDALAHCRAWLAANNLRDPRLRLVVAGSRHFDCGVSWD